MMFLKKGCPLFLNEKFMGVLFFFSGWSLVSPPDWAGWGRRGRAGEALRENTVKPQQALMSALRMGYKCLVQFIVINIQSVQVVKNFVPNLANLTKGITAP